MKKLITILFLINLAYGQGSLPLIISTMKAKAVAPVLAYNPNLWEIEGQSNAEGHEPIANLPGDLAGVIAGCHIYNTNNTSWQSLESGVNNDGNPPAYWEIGGFGAELRLMKLLQTHYLTDQYLIKYNLYATALAQSAGSTGGFDWNTASTGKLYDNSNTNDTTARKLLANTKPPHAFIWIQGEQDAFFSSGAAGAYQANLENFIAGKRSVYGYSTMPVIIVRMSNGQSGYTYKSTVVAAQNTVAAEANNYIVDTDGLSTVDGSHYNAAGYDSIANRIYRVLITL